MFGRKKESNIPAKPKITANLLLMPEAFYGGKDPVVHYQSAKAEIKPPVGGKMALKNKKLFFIIGGILLTACIAGISWYYFSQANQAVKIVQPAVEEENPLQEIPEEKVPEEALQAVVTTTEETATSTEITALSLLERPLEFPQIFLTNSADTDSDSLTDVEEEIFSTDSGTWDTDGDGYYDGQEVYNLYNPKGTAPMRIIDSGLVQEYVNPAWQYRLYYPVEWQVGSVDAENKQVLFSSASGDFIEVNVFEKEAGEIFRDWFARKAGGQNYLDLEGFTNRLKESGFKRNDDLTAYFESGDKVYVFIYHPGTTGFIAYRHVMQLMLQSFRPSKTSIDIPEQVVLPTE